MSRLLLRLSAVTLSLGMLGAAACSSCSPQPTESAGDPYLGQHSYTCGAGTHLAGNQCVGNSASANTASTANKPVAINTSGNN